MPYNLYIFSSIPGHFHVIMSNYIFFFKKKKNYINYFFLNNLKLKEKRIILNKE